MQGIFSKHMAEMYAKESEWVVEDRSTEAPAVRRGSRGKAASAGGARQQQAGRYREGGGSDVDGGGGAQQWGGGSGDGEEGYHQQQRGWKYDDSYVDEDYEEEEEYQEEARPVGVGVSMLVSVSVPRWCVVCGVWRGVPGRSLPSPLHLPWILPSEGQTDE